MFGNRRQGELVPLGHELLVGVLEEAGYRYSVDSDGDVHGVWRGGHGFYFLRLGRDGEIFTVRGHWARTLPIAVVAEAHALCSEWNRDRIFPKTYASVDDDGRVHLFTEVSTDFEPGVTPDQVSQVLECGVATGTQFFEAAEQRFPETVVPNLPDVPG